MTSDPEQDTTYRYDQRSRMPTPVAVSFEILINYYIWSETSSYRPLKAATCKGVKFSIARHIT